MLSRTTVFAVLTAAGFAAAVPGQDAEPPKEEKPSRIVLLLDAEGTVKMEFVRIKPGSFTMGDPESVYRGGNNAPSRQVTLTKDFWMQTTETTQAQWEAVMGRNPSQIKGPDLPVDNVNWNDCHDFLAALNEKAKDQLKGRTAGLPTEAQWEYACRAGSRTKWCFGDEKGRLKDYAWTASNSGGRPNPVARKKPNEWGLYDMHGNVWERCEDRYGQYGGDATDPEGPATGEARCLRGGSFCDVDGYSRSGWRVSVAPDSRILGSGFRTALR